MGKTVKPMVYDTTTGEARLIQADETLDAVAKEVDVMMKPSGSAGAIQKCQPVYVKADANVDLAQADAVATAQVFGLASQEIAVGESGAIQTDGIFTAADWTATTGAVTLTVGSSYFLDAASPGMLTTTAPTTGYNCKVGRAVSATDLDLNIRDSFKL